MTWVKICGTTNLEDALTAAEAGADAVGFVFYEGSPRSISVEAARAIVGKLPESVEKVGVFVGEAAETVRGISERAGLTLAQTYPDFRNPLSIADDQFLEKALCRVIVALPANRLLQGESDDPDGIVGFRVSNRFRERVAAILLDSGSSDHPGGTGKMFDWEGVSAITKMTDRIGLNLILAGGLTPQNVSQGMTIVKPWGVDVASGVEASLGKKDPEKVRAFVRAVREAERLDSSGG
jgi:phosphoribosylanthranilate isomerase